VFVKHFEIETTPGNPASRVRLETRLLAQDVDGVRGYSYRWNVEGTEAALLDGADTRTLTIEPEGEPPGLLTWEFPSRTQCIACHTEASGGVLGLETRQLNASHDYGCVQSNQLAVFDGWGLLEPPLDSDPSTKPAFPEPLDASEPVESRARAFLHANCAHCHMPGGPTGTGLDLRATTALESMGAVGQPATKPYPGGDTLLIPGDAESSVLVRRLEGEPGFRMPPLATSVVPSDHVEVVRDWVDSLSP
jgi:mono/diheme cytochrome c family protein